MNVEDAKKLKNGDTIYYGTCPVKFIGITYRLNTPMVDVYDELPFTEHIDTLRLESVSKRKGDSK